MAAGRMTPADWLATLVRSCWHAKDAACGPCAQKTIEMVMNTAAIELAVAQARIRELEAEWSHHRATHDCVRDYDS